MKILLDQNWYDREDDENIVRRVVVFLTTKTGHAPPGREDLRVLLYCLDYFDFTTLLWHRLLGECGSLPHITEEGFQKWLDELGSFAIQLLDGE